MKNYYYAAITCKRMSDSLIFMFVHCVFFLGGLCLSYTLNEAAGILLILWALVSYVFHKNRTKDLIDAVAVFSVTWIGGIGLAQFRLSAIQTPWRISVWITFALVPLFFWMAFSLTQYELWRFKKKKNLVRNPHRTNGTDHPYKPKKYIIIALWGGVLCFMLMLFQYKIKGFFPALSNDPTARFNFYTKLIIIIAGTQAFVPLFIEVLFQGKIKKWKQILLIGGILVIVGATVLRMSRGDSIITVLAATPAFIHGYERKMIKKHGEFKGLKKSRRTVGLFVLGVLFMFILVSSVRPESSDFMKEAFLIPQFDNPILDSKFFSYAYIYVTNGFENFNYAVENCQNFTFGLRQLEPISHFVPGMNAIIGSLPRYVNLYSTTTCLIRDFYLDFYFPGVFLGMIMYGIIMGILHYWYKQNRDFAMSCLYGTGFATCALCFFDAWLSIFTIWLMWGFGVIAWLVHRTRIGTDYSYLAKAEDICVK